ncbi:MAG TPA: MFS transporter, partial [Melioribacteraceae bacterium]|nr:MFS transporter [Melioribacteraceae bacterium]
MHKFVTLATEEKNTNAAILKVVGVGGGGCNAIEYMIKKGLNGVEYIAVNTDAQALLTNSANQKVQIGVNITKGLGAGADPTIGKKSAEEDRERITKVLEGSNMVFIACGMGGGTGTGAAPMIASIARHMGILTVGIVTKPFKWEGKKRMLNAEKGIQELSQYVDSMIVIPNSRLISLIEKGTAALDAFEKPNDVLYQATRGIADIITYTGVINVALPSLREQFSLSPNQEGLVVSAVLIGAMFGPFLSGFLTDLLGRKKINIIASLVFVLGSIVAAMASSVNMLIGGRL